MMEQDPLVFSGNVPAFLIKLQKLVEDSSVDDLISWSKNGSSFIVHDPVAFARDVLPLYFKHSNFTSFVRQLNMYGFKKVVSSEHGGIKPDKDEWEFHHPSFIRHRQDLLGFVKRKVHPEDKKVKNNSIAAILDDVKELQMKNEAVNHQLRSVKEENEVLWQQIDDLRLKHRKQQHVLNKLIKFLILVYGRKAAGGVSTAKRLAIEPGKIPSKKQRRARGSDVDELDDLQYSVTSPVRSDALIPIDAEQNSKGPQIVVLPDEPVVQNTITTLSSMEDADSFQSSAPANITKTEKPKSTARKGKHSTKSKNDSLKLELPTMVSIASSKDQIIDFSPSILQNVAPMFPIDPFSTTNDALRELQTSFPSSEGLSAVIPANSISTPNVAKEEIDFDVDQINESLDSLQSMLAGPNYNIDSETLVQLFSPNDPSVNANILSTQSSPERLQDESYGHETVTQTQSEEPNNMEPFSPGMFLNDEISNEETMKDEDTNDDSLL